MHTVLVTGGCGFIGSALVRRLLARGFCVHNIDKRTQAANPSLDHLEGPQYHWHNIDLAQGPAPVAALLARTKPRFIFHLAAETHVDNSIAAPLVSVQNNVLGAANLLEAVRTSGAQAAQMLEKIVWVSTDEVYGDCADTGPNHAFLESHKLQPSSPYSASKSAADQLALAWHRTFGVPVVLSRCSNNYGPWQFPEKLIPKFIARALVGSPLPLYGDGLQQREWLYVEDHVSALMLLAERGQLGEIYNVGSDALCTNRELINTLCQLLDAASPAGAPHATLITQVEDRPGHDRCYKVCWQKIKALGWAPATSLADGLQQTVAWYLANRKFLAAGESK
ncbi:dTDP-glucose 4,6-dehydratase [Simiduia sp. 21SJ11W-1]|uniref:dTDP-glucose 4,6-dehydratase n=1 Tax=Simiduia sp. 21SJ11W-1 TaxID=2909669 RepID=UPI0020A130AD|nr:dTDP-glucose 4,6-dehydratase [Simiduia sp. 21SJ11W-1]UTA48138.1 dTDP-glucose 4,6-dehydratase [Simiduia sp. 21SJ11W-1]